MRTTAPRGPLRPPGRCSHVHNPSPCHKGVRSGPRLVGLGATRRPFGDGLLPTVPCHYRGHYPKSLSFRRAIKSGLLKPHNLSKTKIPATLQTLTYSTFVRPKPSTFERPPTESYPIWYIIIRKLPPRSVSHTPQNAIWREVHDKYTMRQSTTPP